MGRERKLPSLILLLFWLSLKPLASGGTPGEILPTLRKIKRGFRSGKSLVGYEERAMHDYRNLTHMHWDCKCRIMKAPVTLLGSFWKRQSKCQWVKSGMTKERILRMVNLLS
jgi:hypothetical protein